MPAGFFMIESHNVAIVYMLPNMNDPVASWNDLLRIIAAPDLLHPIRLRWMNADGTARRDASRVLQGIHPPPKAFTGIYCCCASQ